MSFWKQPFPMQKSWNHPIEATFEKMVVKLTRHRLNICVYAMNDLWLLGWMKSSSLQQTFKFDSFFRDIKHYFFISWLNLDGPCVDGTFSSCNWSDYKPSTKQNRPY